MSLPTEPPDWGDIFEQEDPAFYSYENERFRSYCEYVERPRVRNYVVRLLGRFRNVDLHPNAGIVEDDVFTKVRKGLDGQRLAALPSATRRWKSFRAFVNTIARNDVFDIVRKELGLRPVADCERELQRLSVKQYLLSERALREFHSQVDEVLARRLVALKIALSKLSEADRMLLWEHAEGVSYEVLAEALGCSITALRVRHCRAMKRLRELVRVELPDDPEFPTRQERGGDDEEKNR